MIFWEEPSGKKDTVASTVSHLHWNIGKPSDFEKPVPCVGNSRELCLFFTLIKAYCENEWHCRGRKLALWSSSLISALEEQRRDMYQGPWKLSWTEFDQFLSICRWQGYTWLLNVNAPCIKSSSIIPHYSPSKMGASSKQLCSLCREITIKPAFSVKLALMQYSLLEILFRELSDEKDVRVRELFTGCLLWGRHCNWHFSFSQHNLLRV